MRAESSTLDLFQIATNMLLPYLRPLIHVALHSSERSCCTQEVINFQEPRSRCPPPPRMVSSSQIKFTMVNGRCSR